MSKSMPTPGPWFAVNAGTKREPMMEVRAARIAGAEPRHCVAIVCTGDSHQEMENANAHAISATPDLMGACELAYQVIARIPGWTNNPKAVNALAAISAAMAKATNGDADETLPPVIA